MLQIRVGNRDDLEQLTIYLHENIFCAPSLEPSRRDGCNEGSQHMFLLRNKKNYFGNILKTAPNLELCPICRVDTIHVRETAEQQEQTLTLIFSNNDLFPRLDKKDKVS